MARSWNFGLRKRWWQYQTQESPIYDVNTASFLAFDLEPSKGAQVDTIGDTKCIGLASLHLVYCSDYSDNQTQPDLYIFIFDAAEGDADKDLNMPVFVERVPYHDTLEYEAPTMQGSKFAKASNSDPDRDELIWQGYRFKRGIRVVASSTPEIYTPVTLPCFYISEAITYHFGGC